MPLIRTKLLPVTKTKGTRVKAYYQEETITIGYSYSRELDNLEHNHRRAYIALMNKLEFEWFDWIIQSERLNTMEFVHIWSNQVEDDKVDNLPEILKPQA